MRVESHYREVKSLSSSSILGHAHIQNIVFLFNRFHGKTIKRLLVLCCVQNCDYLHLIILDPIHGQVVWVQDQLFCSEHSPRFAKLVRFQNINLLSQLCHKSRCPCRVVFGNVGGYLIKSAKRSIRPAKVTLHTLQKQRLPGHPLRSRLYRHRLCLP